MSVSYTLVTSLEVEKLLRRQKS